MLLSCLLFFGGLMGCREGVPPAALMPRSGSGSVWHGGWYAAMRMLLGLAHYDHATVEATGGNRL